MAGIALIAAIGIFAIGVFVGIVAMVSHGIHREQQRYERTYAAGQSQLIPLE